MPEEKGIEEAKKGESHVGFKVCIPKICKTDKNQKKDEEEVPAVTSAKYRNQQDSYDKEKAGNPEFDEVVEELVVGRAHVFGPELGIHLFVGLGIRQLPIAGTYSEEGIFTDQQKGGFYKFNTLGKRLVVGIAGV